MPEKRGSALLAAILAIIICGALIYAFFRVFLNSQENATKKTNIAKECSWRPSEDYGQCDLTLGAYYNGVLCEEINGCGVGKDKLPFLTLGDCEKECVK